MNTISLIGRLTKKPELTRTQSGKTLSQFTIAVNRIGQEQADFINCVVWEKQAENLAKYQDKGSLIGLSGSLRVEQFQDKDGNNRYKTYVLVNNIEYLQSKSSETPNEPQKETNPFSDFGKNISIDNDFLE